MKEVGRNSPCPCGSGKKYKACCGKEAEKSKGAKSLLSRVSATTQTEITGKVQGLASLFGRMSAPQSPPNPPKSEEKNEDTKNS